ncbi:MAG: ferrous iron transporter B, partial [Deltaproteobacteria bacterium]|nr:ferrous iron transporter B [Deltaproteobacteria bacterium]
DAQTSRDILIHNNEILGILGIIVVADAKNLTQSISVALQYAEFGLPMIFNLNMTDESASLGIEIDIKGLSEILGISVVSTIARDGIGISRILSHMSEMRVARKLMEYPDWINKYFELVEKRIQTKEISSRIIGILLLTGDSGIEKYIERRFGPGMLTQLKSLTTEYSEYLNQPASILLTNLHYKKAEQIAAKIRKVDPPSRSPFIARFGGWCTSLSTGLPIAAIVLFILYQFVGAFGATFLVDTINTKLFKEILIPAAEKIVAPIPSAFIRDMIVDPDFGILPTGVFLALGLVLPVLFCFYIAFGILEDSGYLARFSILLDKVFQKMGLNGKGVIPLAMGFSCITMAILTTRMLDTDKEKNIATFLLLLGLPCAPLIAVMFIILGKMPVSASIAVFGIIFLQIFIAGFLANKILPGKRSPLIMVIPNMRMPKPIQILKSASLKTYFFMKEAVPVFILASLIVFLFERMGGLTLLEQLSKPVIKDFMGLPEKSVQVFIKTIIRRESGATEIEHLSNIYTNVQLVVNLLVMTFLFPCINATIVLFKERGTRAAVTIMTINVVYAILIGSIVSHACRILGITFT